MLERVPRVELRPLTAAAAEGLLAGDRYPGERWVADYPSDGDVLAATMFLERCRVGEDPRPFGTYQVVRRHDEMVIGGAGFHGPPDEHGAVTVGYGIVPSARGHGYATAALTALVELARTQGAAVVLADTELTNPASMRVLEKVGLRPVGEDERLRYYRLVLRHRFR